jgi:hypothetical protein
MEIGKTIVYVPDGAKINLENTKMTEPKVDYEKRRSKIVTKEIKQISGGEYGKQSNDGN